MSFVEVSSRDPDRQTDTESHKEIQTDEQALNKTSLLSSWSTFDFVFPGHLSRLRGMPKAEVRGNH